MEGNVKMSVIAEKMPVDFDPDCLLRPGNTNCGGCGMSNGLTMLGRALDGEDYSMVIPACCGIVTAGAYPTTSYNVPVLASTFASAPAFARSATSLSTRAWPRSGLHATFRPLTEALSSRLA